MRQAVIYARYSTDNQNPKSIEDQIAYCKEHIAHMEEMSVVRSFSDYAISGTKIEREGLRSMLDYIRSHEVDAIVVESIDRLSRNAGDIHKIYEVIEYNETNLISVNEGGKVSDLLIGLKGTMNSIFVKETAQRVRRSHRERAKEGLLPGGKAYGYKVKTDAVDENGKRLNGVREIVEKEAKVVRRIYQMYADGAGSRAISQRLNAELIPSPSGGFWTGASILGTKSRETGILGNNLYRGKLVYNRNKLVRDPATKKSRYVAKPQKEWVTKDIPELRIVDEGLWNKVQSRRLAPKPQLSRPPQEISRSQSRKHLSGLVFCGVCGAKSQRANDQRYVCGAYRGHKTCNNTRGIRSDLIMGALYERLEKFVYSTDFQLPFILFFDDEMREAEKHNEELQEIDRKIGYFVGVIAEGINLQAIKEGLHELQSQRASVFIKTHTNIPNLDNNEMIAHEIWTGLEEMREEYYSESFAPSWRAAMSLVIERIVTLPIPDKQRGMMVEVEIAPMTGWAEFYRRITAKQARG